MSDIKPRSRRWLQFSLRSLLLIFLLVAVFFGGRESGRRLLEAEMERTASERQKAELAEVALAAAALKANEMRLQLLALELEENRQKLRDAEGELRQSERELEELEEKQQKSRANAGLRQSVRDLERLQFGIDRLPTTKLPINEYWHRKEHPRRLRDA